MSPRRIFASAFLILSVAASASQADPHHKHKHHDDHREHRREQRHDFRQEAEYREWKRQQARREALRADREEAAYRQWLKQQKARRQAQRGCPQGLVAVRGECLKPQNVGRYQVGDRLQGGNFNAVSNPGLYNLQQLAGTQYYSDNNSIYQVDSRTQKIMAVMNLMQMMNAMGGAR